MAQKLTITVATREQQILVICQLLGQLSDGCWENARPLNHWKKPCSAKILVDPANVGCNFLQARRYNFTNADLLDAVGEEMREQVMMAREYPTLSPETIRFCDSGEWAWKVEDTKYYDGQRAELAAVGINSYLDLLGAKQALSGYPMKDLKKDLKAIQEAFNTYR